MSGLLTHVEWILNNYRDQLKKALDEQDIDLSAEQALETMQAADPSERKLAVQWIFNSFLSKGYLWEDIACGAGSKVYNTLQLFANNRTCLASDERNLSDYKRLAQLYTAVQQFDVAGEESNVFNELNVSNKSLKRQIKQEVLEESLIVYRDENLIVSVPQTERASKWWGKGTQWCTAADQGNYFSSYNDEAPLIVLTFPQGLRIPRDKYDDEDGIYQKKTVIQKPKGATRLQLWVNGNDVQFMNEQDNLLSESFIQENWQELVPFFMWILCNGVNFNSLVYGLDGVDEKKFASMFSLEQQLKIAQENPGIIQHLKKSARLEKIFRDHIKNLTADADLIPKNLWTQDIARAYLLKNLNNINMIPIGLITFELCSSLLEQTPQQLHQRILCNILSYKQTPKLWNKLCSTYKIANLVYSRNIIEESKEWGREVPTVFKGKAGALKDNEWFKKIREEEIRFKWVPYEHRTKELCEYCIKNRIAELAQVPEPLKTKEICMLALELEQGKIWDVPQKLRDIDVYLLFFNRLNNSLFDIPRDEINMDVFKTLITDRIVKITEMNAWIKENSTDTSYTNYYQGILSGTGEGLLDRFNLGSSLLEKIVEIDPISIANIPKTQQTKQMVITALKQNESLTSSINIDLLDEQAIIEICTGNRKSLNFFKEVFPEVINNIKDIFTWKVEELSGLKAILEYELGSNHILALDHDKIPSLSI